VTNIYIKCTDHRLRYPFSFSFFLGQGRCVEIFGLRPDFPLFSARNFAVLAPGESGQCASEKGTLYFYYRVRHTYVYIVQ
jgi:hypothetical protein